VGPYIFLDTATWTGATGDFDRDGDLDLVVASLRGDVDFILGDGSGSFSGPVSYYVGGSLYSIAAADFDGDGDLDLAIADDGTVTVLLNQCPAPPPCPADLDGDGTVSITDILVLLAAWGTPAGDIDGDGNTGVTDFLAILASWGPCP
jgi:VCBS repeat protein